MNDATARTTGIVAPCKLLGDNRSVSYVACTSSGICLPDGYLPSRRPTTAYVLHQTRAPPSYYAECRRRRQTQRADPACGGNTLFALKAVWFSPAALCICGQEPRVCHARRHPARRERMACRTHPADFPAVARRRNGRRYSFFRGVVQR